MPVCKRCRVMKSSAEMRETAKTQGVSFERAGKLYPDHETHWVCREKRKCRDRVLESKGELQARERVS
jgi:hypothetical protein